MSYTIYKGITQKISIHVLLTRKILRRILSARKGIILISDVSSHIIIIYW